MKRNFRFKQFILFDLGPDDDSFRIIWFLSVLTIVKS